LRLVVLTQETGARAMQTAGQTAVLQNFARVEALNYRYTLTHAGTRSVLNGRGVPRLARQPMSLLPWALPEDDREVLPDNRTTTTTTPSEGAENGTQHVVVVVGGVTPQEQVAIIQAALQVKAEQGRINRSEVCRRVFAGKTGGIHYQKVKAVVDYLESETTNEDG
jgi:hypothetical protein